MSMARRWALRGTLAVVGALTLWGAWLWVRPAPRFDHRRFDALANNRRFDAAERLLEGHLRRAPDDSAGHLLMAQFLLDRVEEGSVDERKTEAKAERARTHLARVRPRTPAEAALVQSYQGKAAYALGLWDEAEAALIEALRLDPTVPEAGWGLLELYYLQRRPREARRLALRLHQVEPDPRDRAQLLLELIRQDAKPPAPRSLVDLFAPIVRAHPEQVRATLALGLALVDDSQADRGLRTLEELVARRPNDAIVWEGYLTGLEKANQPTALAAALERLPAALAEGSRFARQRGRVAEARRDWPAAVAAYRRALADEPESRDLIYLLANALRLTGANAESQRLQALGTRLQAAATEVVPLYLEADALPNLGTAPHPDLYRRLAANREQMLRPDEARAWYRLALHDQPDDPISREALKRLEQAS